MGTTQSQPLLDQLSGYKILKKYPQNNTTHLSHVQTDKQYLLRQLTYTDQNQYTKSLQEHKQRQALNDDHLTHLSRVQGKQIDHLCSNLYKIYAMWQYPYRTLNQQINQHLYQNRKFQDKEIWSILASSILALSTLQKNKIKNQMLTTKTILVDSQGLIKIADPLACGNSNNLQIVHRNRNCQNIYLSPEQCQVLQSHGVYNNSYKSDVWVVGMIILQCGLLQSMSKCYKDQYQRIDYQLINSKLQLFGNQYGEQLKTLIQTMLRRDSKDRPDWVDLQPYARKLQPQGQSASNSSSKQQNSQFKSNFSPYQKNQQSSYVSYPQSLAKPSKVQKVNATYLPSVQRQNQQYFSSNLTTARPAYNTNNLPNYQVTNLSIPVSNVKQPATYQTSSIPYSNLTSARYQGHTSFNSISTPSNYNYASNNVRNYGPPTTFTSTNNQFIQPIQQLQNTYGTTSTYTSYINPTLLETAGLKPAQYNLNIGQSSLTNGNLFPNPKNPADLDIKPYNDWKTTIPSNFASNNETKLGTPKIGQLKFEPIKLQPIKKDYLQQATNTNTFTTNSPYLPYNPPYLNSFTRPASGLGLPASTPASGLGLAGSTPGYNIPANQQNLFTPPSLLYPTFVSNNQAYKKQQNERPIVTNQNTKIQTYGQTTYTNMPNSQKQQKSSTKNQQITKPLIPIPNTNLNTNNDILQRHINTVQSNHQQTYVDIMNENSNSNIQQNINQMNQSFNQKPQFIIETFKQGSKYQGYKYKDMRHGQGKFYYQDGGMYDGNWKNNKMEGFGSLYYQSGELAYQGMWKQDQFQGKGKLYNQYPYNLQGNFNYQNFDQIDEYWTYYQGDFVQDFKKGKGKLMLSNGEYFEGTFENDMVEGPGEFHCRDGRIIKGVWRQNHLVSK